MGAGKSTVARLLAECGAVVIDSDALAREVVGSGTDGLAAVVEAFGTRILDDAGQMDRAAVAQLVFEDGGARRRLEEIIHPRVRARAAELTEAAADDAVVVHDIPLLAEGGLAPTFDLVWVVVADLDVRLERLERRGVDREAALARIRAQTADETRLAIADVVIDNSGTVDRTAKAVNRLWQDRLVPFEENKRRRAVQRYEGGVQILPYDPRWPHRFERLAARLRHVLGDEAIGIEHIGSTAVPGLAAKNVIDVQIGVADLEVADRFAQRLVDAGFPPIPIHYDMPKPFAPDRSDWEKRLHAGADPENLCHVHIRRDGSPGWFVALAMRDFLREFPNERDEYARVKRELAASTGNVEEYAELKDPWFDQVWPRIEEWARDAGFGVPPFRGLPFRWRASTGRLEETARPHTLPPNRAGRQSAGDPAP